MSISVIHAREINWFNRTEKRFGLERLEPLVGCVICCVDQICHLFLFFTIFLSELYICCFVFMLWATQSHTPLIIFTGSHATLWEPMWYWSYEVRLEIGRPRFKSIFRLRCSGSDSNPSLSQSFFLLMGKNKIWDACHFDFLKYSLDINQTNKETNINNIFDEFRKHSPCIYFCGHTARYPLQYFCPKQYKKLIASICNLFLFWPKIV